MANERPVRANSIGGLVEDNDLTSGATTLTSAGLAAAPAIGSTERMTLVIDPEGRFGSPEIVYMTAHTAAATTGTILRGQEGTTAREHPQDVRWIHTATIKDFDGAGGGAGLIGLTVYQPGSSTDVVRTGTTFADVDATNLVVAFTAPPSGKVLVRLSACAYSSIPYGAWNLRDSGGDIANTSVLAGVDSATAKPVSMPIIVSGLTPGTAYTWKWGQAHQSGGAATSTTRYGGLNGAAVMEVWAVNV